MISTLWRALALSVLPLSALAAPATLPNGVSAGPCYQGICEYQLDNGLKVLLYPDESKNRVLVNVTYLVGSKHENYGETGMAHLLEHLLFKGTPSIPDIDKEADRRGFQWNGTTSGDRTNYFEVFDNNPEYLDFALKMEADRMVNSNVAKADLDSEMTVVRNEMERGETEPFRVALKTLQSIAYQWHNYGKSTIGARSDVENVPIERLRDFYRTWYQPDNAVLLVAGPIDADQTLSQIHTYFGVIPKPTRVKPEHYTVEPGQDGEREAVVRRPGTTKLLMAGYHTPPGANIEALAASLANDVLADSTTGRLRKALVEAGLAAGVGGFNFGQRERSQALSFAQLTTAQDEAKAKEIMVATLEGVASTPITEEEFERARTKYRNDLKKTLDDVAQLGIGLSEYAASGDWRLFFVEQQALEKLTLADVQAAAAKHFVRNNRSFVSFIPGKETPTEIAAPTEVSTLIASLGDDPGAQTVARIDVAPAALLDKAQQVDIRPGLRLSMLPKATRNAAVSMTVQLRFGDTGALKDKSAQVGAMVGMLDRGAGELGRVQFADALEQIESDLSFFGGNGEVLAFGRTTRDALPAYLDLLKTALQSPRFDADEFEQWRAQGLAALERAQNEPSAQARQRLSELRDPYPTGHVMAAQDFDTRVAALKALDVTAVAALHRALVGGSDLIISLVGDFDVETAQAQMQTHFAQWNSPAAPARIDRLLDIGKPARVIVDMPEKANGALAGSLTLALRDDDADYPALLIADTILGGGGLSNRIMERIRQKEGWSYGGGSRLSAGSREAVGSLSTFAIAAPENLGKVDDAIVAELQRMVDEGVDAQELDDAKQGWIKSRRVDWSDDQTLSFALLGNADLDRSLAFDADIEAKVAALDVPTVNAAIKKWLQVEGFIRVLAGDAKKIDLEN